jgi:6,7-dimethyl-8-ribityllumazine synthase
LKPGRTFAGDGATAEGVRVALAASRFHRPMVEKLVDGAIKELARLGAREQEVDLAWAPGAFELPLLAQELARSGRYDAILALGVVIRGETPHFDYVCAEAARGVADVSRNERVPVLFGVITADDPHQAQARAGGSSNKGEDVARAAIEFVRVLKEVR